LNTQLASGRVIEGDAWYQRSDTSGLDGDDSAYGLALRSPNNSGIRGGVAFKEVEQNFNPAMGYINRANVRDIAVDAAFANSGVMHAASMIA
jgi:acyl-homoserine lactone acylase PvdQ